MEHIGGQHLTYPTKCRSCGAAVFFHTNGYGDVVFFDSIGWPWPVHACYLVYRSGALVDPTAVRAKMLSVYGRAHSRYPRTVPTWSASPPRPRRKADLDPRRAHPRRPRPEDIVRFDPVHNQQAELEVSGYLREIHPGRAVSERYAPGTAGYSAYVRAVGADIYTQITIIDGELLSYTAVIPLPRLDLKKGALVTAVLKRKVVVGRPIFVCRALSLVALQ